MSSFLQQLILPRFDDITKQLDGDVELRAALTSFRDSKICFGLIDLQHTRAASKGGVVLVVLDVSNDGSLRSNILAGEKEAGETHDTFELVAEPVHWKGFFVEDAHLQRPYQSFWGMLRVIGPTGQVSIAGDTSAFAKYATIWRRVLDVMRNVITDTAIEPETSAMPEEPEEDSVVGRYIWIVHSEYGKVKVFYEFAGSGKQIILFLHTAGSDSRQYHSLMNDDDLQKACTMYAFDLPAHGRSSLGTKQIPEAYALSEEAYIESISAVIEKLKLSRNDNLILCGASMAGHVCLAAAIQARNLGVRGVIPCEGCAHLPLTQPIYEMKGNDSAILDPERVCGMIAPTSPDYYRKQIWWQYSSQGIGVFAGDLKFYFKGWDGRGRLETIDTSYCPVYMLTGEYDYSCTTEASKATADMIPGAVFEAMPKLGHFPLTENPKAVKPFLIKAMAHIQKHRM